MGSPKFLIFFSAVLPGDERAATGTCTLTVD